MEFTIELEAQSTAWAQVIIEADDENQATAKVLQMVRENDIEWDHDLEKSTAHILTVDDGVQ